MTRLTLEFVQRPSVPWAALAFLLVAAGVGAFSLDAWLGLREANIEKAAQLASLQHQSQARLQEVKKKELGAGAGDQVRIKEERAVLAALRYPWNRVLATLEQGGEDGVALLSMTHDSASGATQLSVEALDVPALVRFVAKMNRESDEGDNLRWYLASYQAQPQNTPPTVKGVILGK